MRFPVNTFAQIAFPTKKDVMKSLKQLISVSVISLTLGFFSFVHAGLPNQSVSYATVGEPLFITVRALEKSMGVSIVLQDVNPDTYIQGNFIGATGSEFLDDFTKKTNLAWLQSDNKVLLVPRKSDINQYKQVLNKDVRPSSFSRIAYDPKDKNKLGLMVFQIHNAWVDDKTLNMSGGNTVVPGVTRLFAQFVGMPVTTQSAPAQTPATPPTTSVAKETPVSNQSFKDQQTNLWSLFSKNAKPSPSLGDTDNTNTNLAVTSRGAFSESRLNAVLVRDKVEFFDTYKQIIALLDRPADMVQMDAYIVDIEKSKATDYGVNLGVTGADTLGRQLILTGITSKQFFNNLSLLETKKDGHLLSVPSVVSMNNLEASFSNRQNFFVKVEGNNDATLNKVTAETLLKVTPLIANESDDVPYTQRRIKLNINIQDAVADTTASVPSTKENQITTQATIRSGDTLIIGGQVIVQETDARSGLPILGDLPILGGLFSSVNVVKREYIRIYVVRPQILGADSFLARTQ